MKNKKICIALISIILISIILLVFNNIVLTDRSNSRELPIYYTHSTYLHDTGTPEAAITVADYAFIAKINNIERTEYRHPVEIELNADGSRTKTIYSPYTIYNITVIENIKGNLTTEKNIELEQVGGLDKGSNFYTFPEGTGLLNIGEYYILLAYAPFENGNIQINRPTSIVSLGSIENELNNSNTIKNIISANDIAKITELQNSTLDNEKIKNTAMEKILEYKKASLNPIILEEVIENNKSKYDVYYIDR